jgi:heat shock protein HslJ
MKRHLTALALVLVLGATGGCAEYTTTGVPADGAGPGAEEAAHSEGLEGTSWVLESAAGEASGLGGFEVTASFLEGTMSGQAPVNRYSAEVELGEAGALGIGPVAATKMAGPAEAMEAEAAFFALLEEVTGYAERGETLELLAGSEAVLTFAADSAPAEQATGSTDEPATDPVGPDSDAVALAESLVGMPIEEAESAVEDAGFELRVLTVDGEGGPATSDFRSDRINVDVEDGEVTKATVG